MYRTLAILTLLIPLTGVGGCTFGPWQANNGSQAVEVNPWAWGSGQSVVSPANGPGYFNGDAMDMRTRH